MKKYTWTNILTGGTGDIDDKQLAAAGMTLDQWLTSNDPDHVKPKVSVGHSERRYPVRDDAQGTTIEDNGEYLVLVTDAIPERVIEANEFTPEDTVIPAVPERVFQLKAVRPEWYHADRPDLDPYIDGDEVVLPATRSVVETDISDEVTEAIVAALWENYTAVERRNITPAGAIQQAEWLAAGNAKAVENFQWVNRLYAEADAKEILIRDGDLTVDLNPSEPWKPHSHRDIAAELAQ